MHLDPTARAEAGERLAEIARPVAQADDHHAAVDVVELLVEGPVGFGIVDDEVAVWRHETWLDGGQVGTCNARVWVLVCKVDGPDAGAAADVEDFVEIRRVERGAV